MSENVAIELVKAAVQIVGAAGAMFAAYLSYKSLKASKETKEAIVVLEKNTNSIKDALVATTHREGILQGAAEEKSKADKEKAE